MAVISNANIIVRVFLLKDSHGDVVYELGNGSDNSSYPTPTVAYEAWSEPK